MLLRAQLQETELDTRFRPDESPQLLVHVQNLNILLQRRMKPVVSNVSSSRKRESGYALVYCLRLTRLLSRYGGVTAQ